MEMRPVARLVIFAPTASGEGEISLSAARRAHEVAEKMGHQSSLATQVADIVPSGGAMDDLPEVILLDCGVSRDTAQFAEFAREIKKSDHFPDAPLLAVLPSKARPDLFDALRAAGADDFLFENASEAEIRARLDMACSLARLRRQLSEARDQLAHHTRLDDLTGAMNRRFFFQQAHRECSRARRYGHPLSCLMVDVDHFKNLSETFGYGAGDAVLKTVATILRQWTRDSDLVARFSDHKFAILLPDTAVEGATQAREKITRAFNEQKWTHEERELPVTVSIGEAELPAHNHERSEENDDEESEGTSGEALSTRETLAELLADADAALSVARKGTRTPDVFVPYTVAPNS